MPGKNFTFTTRVEPISPPFGKSVWLVCKSVLSTLPVLTYLKYAALRFSKERDFRHSQTLFPRRTNTSTKSVKGMVEAPGTAPGSAASIP